MTGKLLAGFVAALALSGSAAAASVTWAFEGHLTSFSGEPHFEEHFFISLGLTQTSPFHGRLVFDDETPFSGDDGTDFPGAISILEITIGGYGVAASPGASNAIVMSFSEPAFPYGRMRAESVVGPGPLSYLEDALFRLDLPGSAENPFNYDGQIPVSPPGLVAYPFDEIVIEQPEVHLRANVTSIYVVPEPALLALLAPLALGLAAIRRR